MVARYVTKKKFKAGGECQDTKYNIDQKEYTYNEWKQKIEKSHAKDLLQTLKNTAESRILEKFKDYESYQKEIIEEVRRVLGIDAKLEAEMQKNLQIESKDVDIKLKEMLKSRSQAETDETRICYDIIKSFYRNEDIESELKCRDVSCFENIIGHKELELVNKQDSFLEDTGNILKYIQVEDNIL